MAAKNNKSALADKPYGIVPQNVMRDTALRVQERWLFALLCTHADKKGCCRRSLEAIAGEAGVLRRTVQVWLLSLEKRGLVCKLNEVGKMGVYQIIRHKNCRGAAQMKNVNTVAERMTRFSAFGKKGAVVRAEKRKEMAEPVSTETPPRVQNHTGTGVFPINPEHDSLTGLLEQESKDGHAALPPNGGGAPLKPHIGNASLGAGSICLQESVSLKSSPPFPTRLPSLKAPDGISKADKNEAFARSKLAGSLGWDVLIAADDVEDGNHLSAVENCRREAERLGVSWKPPATGAPKEPVARPTRIKPSLETLQKKGITPDVALAQLVERAQAAA